MTKMLVIAALCAGLAAFDFGESGSDPTALSASAPHVLTRTGQSSDCFNHRGTCAIQQSRGQDFQRHLRFQRAQRAMTHDALGLHRCAGRGFADQQNIGR